MSNLCSFVYFMANLLSSKGDTLSSAYFCTAYAVYTVCLKITPSVSNFSLPLQKRAKPTSGAARPLLPKEGGESGMSSPSTPFRWKGDARRAGGWPKAKRAKPTSGATRHLLPEEGGRSGMTNPSPPSHGRGKPEGRGLVEGEKERSQPPALRATSFQRKEGEAG